MKKFFLTIATALIFAGHLVAQNYQKTPNGIQATINSAKVEVLFFNEATGRVLKSPAGRDFEKKSLSVVAEPQKVKFSVSERNGDLLLSEKSAATFTGFDDAGVKTFSVEQSFALEKEEAIYGLGQHQNGKMYHFHFRDVSACAGNGVDVAVGQGKAQDKEILDALYKNNVKPLIMLEYEKDFYNPVIELIPSVNYINEVAGQLLQSKK